MCGRMARTPSQVELNDRGWETAITTLGRCAFPAALPLLALTDNVDRIGLRDCALYSVICGRHLRLGNVSARSDEPRHLARVRLTNGWGSCDDLGPAPSKEA